MNFYIVTGSMLGTAEYAAEEVQKYCDQQGINTMIFNGPSLKDVKNASHLMVVCSTHGEGEYPDNFLPFVEQIIDAEPAFAQGTKFLLLGIGSKDYDTFCNAIKKFTALIEQQGFKAVVDPLYIDVSDPRNDPDQLTLEYFIKHQQAFLG